MVFCIFLFGREGKKNFRQTNAVNARRIIAAHTRTDGTASEAGDYLVWLVIRLRTRTTTKTTKRKKEFEKEEEEALARALPHVSN